MDEQKEGVKKGRPEEMGRRDEQGMGKREKGEMKREERDGDE